MCKYTKEGTMCYIVLYKKYYLVIYFSLFIDEINVYATAGIILG